MTKTTIRNGIRFEEFIPEPEEWRPSAQRELEADNWRPLPEQDQSIWDMALRQGAITKPALRS